MPNNRNSENKQNQVNQKYDWTQKGFGWVPDYPDIRDFVPVPSTDPNKSKYQKEVQKASISNSIDDLTETLADALSSINDQLQPRSDARQSNLKKIIEDLNDKAYGNVRFSAAKIYSVLRAAPSGQKQEIEREERIIQLKKSLYFLIRSEIFLPSDTSLEGIFKNPELEVKWLTESDFTKGNELEKVIKEFQRAFNLREDGVVGINTYLTLERCFSYKTLSKDEKDFIDNISSAVKDELMKVRKKHILDLKEGLQKLVKLGFLQDPRLSELEEEFGENTEKLIQDFQEKIGLLVNGKVCYRTFIKLNACLVNLANLELSDAASLDFKELGNQLNNPAKLIAISSLIPSDIFAILIDKLLLSSQRLPSEDNFLSLEDIEEGFTEIESVCTSQEEKKAVQVVVNEQKEQATQAIRAVIEEHAVQALETKDQKAKVRKAIQAMLKGQVDQEPRHLLDLQVERLEEYLQAVQEKLERKIQEAEKNIQELLKEEIENEQELQKEIKKTKQEELEIIRTLGNALNSQRTNIVQFIPAVLENQKLKTNINQVQLVDIIKNQFIIVDPIVSVILIMVSPLAEKDNLGRAIVDGIEDFKSLLKKDGTENFKKLHKEDDSLGYLKCLAQTAVQKSLRILESERSEELIRLNNLILQKNEPINNLNELTSKLDQLEDFANKTIKELDDQAERYGDIDNDIKINYVNKKKEDLRIKKRAVEAKKDDIIKMIQDGIINLIVQNLLRKSLESLSNNDSSSSTNVTGETIDFSKKEHFRLIADQEKYVDKKYFGLYPAKNLLAVQTDSSFLNKEKHDDKVLSQQSESLEYSEITLPVSSSVFHQKDASVTSKELYFLLPGTVDLSYWCSPVEDQDTLNTCTACAGVGLLEYFAKRSFGEFEDLSPLFLYKAARDLRRRSGDVGAPLRDIMRSMILFGVPPEQYWPYWSENLDEEPPALCYSYAQNYQTLKYFRLDRADISPSNLLLKVKAVLAAGFPCMFGFTAYTSIYDKDNIKKGYIPFPNPDRDRVTGGHAVVAVGYNDYIHIPHPEEADGHAGALLIRNSWGREWGLGGYGWLPYDYVLKGLTGDWWSLLKAEWFGRGYFGLDARDPGGPDPYGPNV